MPRRTVRAVLVCTGSDEDGKPCAGRKTVDGWTELRPKARREALSCGACGGRLRVSRTELAELPEDDAET